MEWSAEADVFLLSFLERYRPCGVHRPWAIASLRLALRSALPSILSSASSPLTCEAVAARVNSYYNFNSSAMADVRDALERPLRQPRDYKLPRKIWLSERILAPPAAGASSPAKREAAGDGESAGSEPASPAEPIARDSSAAQGSDREEGDERRKKRRRSTTSPSKATVVDEASRRRLDRLEEVFRSVRARTGRYTTVSDMTYGALRELGGSATLEAVVAHITSKDVWGQLERKQALRLERDGSGEVQRQVEEALAASVYQMLGEGKHGIRGAEDLPPLEEPTAQTHGRAASPETQSEGDEAAASK